MTRSTIAGGAIATVLILLALVLGAIHRIREQDVDPSASPSSAITTSMEDHQSYIHGRVTTHDGVTYDGRLRWSSYGQLMISQAAATLWTTSSQTRAMPPCSGIHRTGSRSAGAAATARPPRLMVGGDIFE